MTKYRKTALIEAEQFDSSDEMIHKYNIYITFGSIPWDKPNHKDYRIFVLKTVDGDIELIHGDWIATGIDGEHWVIRNDIFKQTYKQLPVISHYAAEIIEWTKEADKTLADVFRDYDEFEDRVDDIARAWLDGYEVRDE
ncbi:DUF1642 domain-containing protein [Paucilactobacillus kaifaensis]|uniref:DUF1642 domain-containing protein n=1 Tax=Paucilactobacillus kaifaensis TaxID=2559921 RepID=UPI0010F784DB|nr:DUF1642 domain-containing protein [Paucilactobacillus kaifaensis]